MKVRLTHHFRDRLLSRFGLALSPEEEGALKAGIRLELALYGLTKEEEAPGGQFEVKVRGVRFVVMVKKSAAHRDEYFAATVKHWEYRRAHLKPVWRQQKRSSGGADIAS